jgi:PAS domain S-box-containing protein
MSLASLLPSGYKEILSIIHSNRQAAGLALPELPNCFVQVTPVPEINRGAVLCFFDARLWKPYLGNAGPVDPLSPYINRIIDESPDGLSVIDRHGIMIKVNQAAANFVGLKRSKLEGQHVSYLLRKNLVDSILSLDVLRTRQTISRLIDHRRSGKKVLSTGSPIFDRDGEVDLVLLNERDINTIISQQKKMEIGKSDPRVKKNLDYSLELEGDLGASDSVKEEMVARDPAMSAVLGTAAILAHHNVSHVLVCGESGTGKSLLARYIHANSSRADQPFVHVNCAAMPEPLLEAELFGYEKGAFTGSDPAGKAGLLENARGGTLFLRLHR